MKKVLFGLVLLFCGMIGLTSIVILSVNNHPWGYNDIDGFFGFLLGSETLWFLIFSSLMFIFGLLISVYEAYFNKDLIKKIFK